MHILTWCKNSIHAHTYGHTHQYISDKIFPLLLGKPCKKNNRKRFYCKCYKLDGNMHKVLANNTTLNIILKHVIRYIIWFMCNDYHFKTDTILYFSEWGENSQGTHQMEIFWDTVQNLGAEKEINVPIKKEIIYWLPFRGLNKTWFIYTSYQMF